MLAAISSRMVWQLLDVFISSAVVQVCHKRMCAKETPCIWVSHIFNLCAYAAYERCPKRSVRKLQTMPLNSMYVINLKLDQNNHMQISFHGRVQGCQWFWLESGGETAIQLEGAHCQEGKSRLHSSSDQDCLKGIDSIDADFYRGKDRGLKWSLAGKGNREIKWRVPALIGRQWC